MVRQKQRYLVVEIIPESSCTKKLRLEIKESDFYSVVKKAIQSAHGDYGLGNVQMQLKVKYLNPFTHVAMVRVKRGAEKMIMTALSFITHLNKMPVALQTLHIAGTIRSCQKFLVGWHHRQLPSLMQLCEDKTDRKAIQSALINAVNAVGLRKSDIAADGKQKRKSTGTGAKWNDER